MQENDTAVKSHGHLLCPFKRLSGDFGKIDKDKDCFHEWEGR